MKQKYERELSDLNLLNDDVQRNQQELKKAVCEKISCENKYSVDNLINFLNNEISIHKEERDKIMYQYFQKKIDWWEFTMSYKKSSMKFHELNIYKDKLNQVISDYAANNEDN